METGRDCIISCPVLAEINRSATLHYCSCNVDKRKAKGKRSRIYNASKSIQEKVMANQQTSPSLHRLLIKLRLIVFLR